MKERIFTRFLMVFTILMIISATNIIWGQDSSIPGANTDSNHPGTKVKEKKNVTPPAPDPDVILQGGDDIASATYIPFTDYYYDSGTTAGYTDDYDEICPGSSTSPDVVYLFIPELEGFIDISLCESSYDTKLYVYEFEEGIPLDCNDDGCGVQSHLSGLLVYPGQELYIVVDGSGGEFGDYIIEITGFFIYNYLPGDVNMAASTWPPIVAGNDLVYLVNFYRGMPTSQSCLLDGFWVSADVNGDCMVMANDITRLVSYFRGLSSLSWCWDFEPAWPTPDYLPPSAPPDWPPCEDSFLDSLTHDVYFWFGNVDGSPIYSDIDDNTAIDVFVQTDDSAYIGDLFIPVGIEDQYIDSFLTDIHELYYPLTEWDLTYFSEQYNSPPNPAGWSSQSFTGVAETSMPQSLWLHAETPLQIMRLYALPVNDTANIGDSVHCIAEGETLFALPLRAGDTLGLYDYPITSNFSPVIFDTDEATFEYLPGDINMAYGGWPPSVAGSDVTYLVQFFKNNPSYLPCYLSNPDAPSPPGTAFWASADANGDCLVTGNDIIHMVRFLRGQIFSIQYCPDYPPVWITPLDLPAEAPDGWPNCEPNPNNYSDPFESSPDPDITFWYGNLNGSPLTVEIGERANIDVYVATSDTAFGGYVLVSLGTEDQYFDSLLSTTEGQIRYPFNEWFTNSFSEPYGSPPNPTGWSSQSFIGLADNLIGNPWLNTTTPLNVLTFVAKVSDSPELSGDTIQCIGVGGHPTNVLLYVGDTLGVDDYPVAVNVSPVYFTCSSERGSIAGEVTDYTSYGLSNVYISASGPSPAGGFTDFDGLYVLECLEPGTYDVSFSGAGYSDTTVYGVNVSSGATTPLNVILQELPDLDGWLYHKPFSIIDTTNANSVIWDGIWLLNYDENNSVMVDSVMASEDWIIVDELSAYVISTQDSVFIPITFDLTSFYDVTVTGTISIYHNGLEAFEEIECQIDVTSEPPIGPVIRTFPPSDGTILSDVNLELEPDVNGFVNIQVFNDGDLPLILENVTDNVDWIDSLNVSEDTVTTLESFDLMFEINTTGYAGQQLNGTITIENNDENVIVTVAANIAEENVAGQNSYGDVNFDGWCNEADIDYLIDFLFRSGPPPCSTAADADGNDTINISDVVYLADYLRGTGPSPLNACESISTYRDHELNNQIQLSFISGSRGDWVSIPVYVQNSEYYKSQISIDCAAGLIDSVRAQDVSGMGFQPYAVKIANETRDSVSIVLSDSSQSFPRISFDSLTLISYLQVRIDDNAPLGIHSLKPTSPTRGRGPSMFNQDDEDNTIRGPMFHGTLLTVNPEVTLDYISGIPSVNYYTSAITLTPSLTITSDAAVGADIYLNIINVSDSSIVYSDTIYAESILEGTNVYSLSRQWTTTPPGVYKTIAAVNVLDNESDVWSSEKGVHFTDQIYVGIPPSQGFEEGSMSLGGSDPTIPELLYANWNEGWRNISADGRTPPEWQPAFRVDVPDDDYWCAEFSAYDVPDPQGPHDDWLIYGPWTPGDTTLVNPTVSFYERGEYWSPPHLTRGYRHEVYIIKDRNVVLESLPEANAIYTPQNHSDLTTTWRKTTIQLADSIVESDTMWLAFRYMGEVNSENFDLWDIDKIEWTSGNRYAYMPGDVNMYHAEWIPPPLVNGSDVTYLLNFFRGYSTSHACYLDGFWASADANGDCFVTGPDVTKLVNHFRGETPLSWCHLYEPLWQSPGDLPTVPPDGWPYCEEGNALLRKQIVPREQRLK